MNIENINSWEIDDPEIKSMLEQLNLTEEKALIENAKEHLANDSTQINDVIHTLNEFMSLWENGTRKFFLLPDFVEMLKDNKQ